MNQSLKLHKPCKVALGNFDEKGNVYFNSCLDPNCVYAHSIQELWIPPCNNDVYCNAGPTCLFKHSFETLNEYYARLEPLNSNKYAHVRHAPILKPFLPEYAVGPFGPPSNVEDKKEQ